MSDIIKLTEAELDASGVISAADVLTGTAAQNKAIFDNMGKTKLAEKLNEVIDKVNASSAELSDNVVKVTAQELTEQEKAQARENIGAGTSSFDGKYTSLTEKPTIGGEEIAGAKTLDSYGYHSANKVTVSGNALGEDAQTAFDGIAEKLNAIDSGSGKPIIKEAQELTEQEKAQARENIGAGTSSFDGAAENVSVADNPLGENVKAALDSIYDGMLKLTAETKNPGEVLEIYDAGNYPIAELSMYGNSSQDGTPTPTAPVDIVSAVNPTFDIMQDSKNSSFTLPETYPMRSMDCDGDVISDEFKLDGDGKVYHIQRLYYGPMPEVSKISTTAIGKFVSRFEPSIDPDILAGTATDIFMCTHFAQGGSGSERIYLHNSRGRMQLSTSLTVNDINNLSNCFIMYPIAPITTEITDSGIVSAVKALTTYAGTTTITCDVLCKIKYRADATAAYNNLLKKINELQSAVITLGGTI